jgi:ABC-type amino acid transport substrate-binding protein
MMRQSGGVEGLKGQDPAEIGPFKLLGRLGVGGMGRVYLGRSPGGQRVAVKVIREDIADDPQALKRFQREVETARLVRSAYTASLIDASLDAPPFWLATEFVPGPTLLRAVRDAPLPADLGMGLFAALAEGLAAVHEQGVVHRDLKPHNVLLAATGPKLIDFGLARAADYSSLTRADQTPGTAGYIAPEVLTGSAEAGPAVDVFALGVTMAAAVTGRQPYGGGEWAVVNYRAVYEEIDLTGLEDPELAGMIRACVAREPGDRPGLDEIIRRCGVGRVLADDPAYQVLVAPAAREVRGEAGAPSVPTASPAPPATPPARRGRGRLLAAALAVTGVLAATVVWVLREDGSSGGRGADETTGERATGGDNAAGTSGSQDGGTGEGETAAVEGADGGGDDGTLTIGARFDRPGLSQMTADGDIEGFDIEMAEYIAEYIASERNDPLPTISWRAVPADGRETALINGEVDLVVDAYGITPERARRVDFAGPYLRANVDLLIRIGDEFSGVEDLNDMTLCSVTGSDVTEGVISTYAPEADVQNFGAVSECLAALSQGSVDAVPYDDAILAGYAAQDQWVGEFQLAGLELGSSDYGVGVPQGDTELRDAVDAALRQMVTDGSWNSAINEHLGPVVGYDPEPPPQIVE